MNRGGRGVVNLIDVGTAEGLATPWDNHAALLRNVLKVNPSDGTIDTAVEQGDGIRYHLLKIDAPNAETNILGGAERFLGRDCLAVQITTLPQQLPEIDTHMDTFEFSRVRTTTVGSRRDVLYVRRSVSPPREMYLIGDVYQLGSPSTG